MQACFLLVGLPVPGETLCHAYGIAIAVRVFGHLARFDDEGWALIAFCRSRKEGVSLQGSGHLLRTLQ